MRVIAVAVACVLVLGSTTHAQDTPEQAAAKAAGTWVAMIDSGKYPESWDAAAKVFQGQLSREQWVGALGTVRTPLGKLLSREQKSAQLTVNAPNAPGQRIVLLQFTTSFENKRGATETIAMVDENGTWKAVGYFIQ